MARVVPPAWSPIAVSSLVAGLRGLAGGRSTVARLEAALAGRFGADAALGTDSGTTALRLAIAAAATRREGAAVALPAWGCFDLATAADGAGVPVVLYDVDPATLGPDWASFERAVGVGVASAVVVHPFGLAVDVARAAAISRAAGALLIEDAAQAAGALIEGRLAGSSGDFTVLSFGRGKGLTGGGGGALLARRGAGLPDPGGLGRSPLGGKGLVLGGALLVASRPRIYGVLAALPFLGLGETPYHPPRPPRSLPPGSAGVVLDTLDRLDEARRDRTGIAGALRRAAGRVAPSVVPALLAGSEPAFLRCPLVVPGGAALAREAAALGVMPGYPRALVDLAGFGERIDARGERFPGARRLAGDLITLPTHRWVSRADLAALERWLETVLPGATR